jgi:hypothetical protein
MPVARHCAVGRARVVAVAGVVVTAALAAVAPPSSAAAFDQRWNSVGAGVHRSSPTLGDLSVGRVVLSGDMHGWVRALRADGSVAWRSAVDPVPGVRAAVESSPAVGDLDGRAGNEVVVGAGASGGDPAFREQHGGVVAYRGDGSVLWRWVSPDRRTPGGAPDGYGDSVYSSPAIGDVDGDRVPDVVFGGWDQQIWALRGSDGAPLAGFPFEQTDTVFSSPALYDVDRDGRYEIFIGGDQSGNPAVPGSYNGGVLRALDVEGGAVVQRWRYNVPDIVASSPAIGDINGDGRLEVVFGSGGYWNPPDDRRMWAAHVDDGSPVPGWPQTTAGMVFGSPALGDVVPGDGGRPEVVVGDVKGNLYAWHGNGALAWRSDPGKDDDTFYGGPSIGDLDGDGDQDVAIGYGFGGALLVRGTDGGLMRRVASGPYASESTPLIADFGADGGRQLVVAGWNPGVPDLASGAVAAFELPSTSAASHWPMFHADPRHLGGPESVEAKPVPAARTTDDSCPAGEVPGAGFSDVPASSAHAPAIDCVVWWGVANGQTRTQYGPAGDVTRAQMATFVANTILESGGSLPEPSRDWFGDDNGTAHERNINRLREAGVVSGRGEGTFGATLPVSRAAMASFLVSAYEYRTGQALGAAPDYFYDDAGSVHEANINTSAASGFTGGTANGGYSPAVAVRRDQMASFLARVLDALVEAGSGTPPA